MNGAMQSLKDSCVVHFGCADFYKILGIEESANIQEVRKGYHKMSLIIHPDKCDESKKQEYTEKFKILSKIHDILSDKEKRAIYDETGNSVEDFLTKQDWFAYQRQTSLKMTREDISEYEKKYRDSTEELTDLKTAYVKGKGDLDFILDTVPFANPEEEPRLRDLLQPFIDSGELPKFEAFTHEPPAKREERMRKWQKEAEEARRLEEEEEELTSQEEEEELTSQEEEEELTSQEEEEELTSQEEEEELTSQEEEEELTSQEEEEETEEEGEKEEAQEEGEEVEVQEEGEEVEAQEEGEEVEAQEEGEEVEAQEEGDEVEAQEEWEEEQAEEEWEEVQAEEELASDEDDDDYDNECDDEEDVDDGKEEELRCKAEAVKYAARKRGNCSVEFEVAESDNFPTPTKRARKDPPLYTEEKALFVEDEKKIEGYLLSRP